MRLPARIVAATLVGVLATAPVARAMSESEMGRRFLLEARSQLPVVDDPAVAEYVDGVGRRLVKTLGPQPWDYKFYVVQDPSLNAFAVPGGYVFVFSGLLARVANDDELAGVLAHELGHVTAHHIVRAQEQGTAWNAAALLGALLSVVHPVLGAAAIGAAETAQLKYSREFEQEADYIGLRHASEAGYDPHALGAFFKELLAEQRLNPAGVPPYMLTHPLTETRVANVDTIISAQKLTTPKGRPAAGPELPEAQAVSRAIADPPEVVVARYKKLVDEKPDDAQRHFLLGRVYQTIGQLDAARSSLEKARELGMGERVDRPLGAVYVSLKQPDKAREVLGPYLAHHPDDGWAHLQLGKAMADGGDNAGSLVEFQRALALDGELDEAHRLLGVALGRHGEEAEGFYHLAVASRQRGELEQSLSHFERADQLLSEGSPRKVEVAKAIEELRPIVRELERERLEHRRSGNSAHLEQRQRRAPFPGP